MNTASLDTDDRRGRIVGVEDDQARAWCFECSASELRAAGETPFMADLYAGWDARRKCVNCGRKIGEVQG